LFCFFAEKCVCGPNVRPHQWTSRCRCSTALSLLQEVYIEIENIPPTASVLLEHTKRAAFQLSHIWGQCQAICSHARWLGLEEVWWTMESCMDHTTLDRQGFYYELPSCKCKKTCKGNCKCHRANLQCTSLNHCELVMDSVMETELTARPDTNSGLHYKPMYMYRGQLSWIQICSYTYSLPEKVSHSYCYSNCLRFKTVDLRNYVLTVAILESSMAGIGY